MLYSKKHNSDAAGEEKRERSSLTEWSIRFPAVVIAIMRTKRV